MKMILELLFDRGLIWLIVLLFAAAVLTGANTSVVKHNEELQARNIALEEMIRHERALRQGTGR